MIKIQKVPKFPLTERVVVQLTSIDTAESRSWFHLLLDFISASFFFSIVNVVQLVN